jgi:hypothetical protein
MGSLASFVLVIGRVLDDWEQHYNGDIDAHSNSPLSIHYVKGPGGPGKMILYHTDLQNSWMSKAAQPTQIRPNALLNQYERKPSIQNRRRYITKKPVSYPHHLDAALPFEQY